MKRLNPYIGFKGKTREALGYYQSIFGGEATFMTVGETPQEVQSMCPPGTADQVMHGQLDLGAFALMGTDMGDPNAHPAHSDCSRISVAIDCSDKAEIEKLYRSLGEGGSIGCPLGPAFWGGDFGMVTDKYGVNWLLTLMPQKP